MTFGEQTTNEMCFAFFTYTFDNEHISKGQTVSDANGFEANKAKFTIKKIFDHFDANHDGALDVDELADVIAFFQSAADEPKGKPQDPKAAAKFVISMYGKTTKGKLSVEEFGKMAKQMN